jgi:hypothetical protein
VAKNRRFSSAGFSFEARNCCRIATVLPLGSAAFPLATLPPYSDGFPFTMFLQFAASSNHRSVGCSGGLSATVLAVCLL